MLCVGTRQFFERACAVRTGGLLGSNIGQILVNTSRRKSGTRKYLAQLFDVQSLNPLLAGVVLPVLAVVLAYAIILQVVNQLALHSLAHNRRGVASALTHAWRLVRGSPWGALRATIGD